MGRVTRFSANLGFLWTDRPLADAVRAAAAAGFDAVECHWPYDEHAGAVQAALAETRLARLGQARSGQCGPARLGWLGWATRLGRQARSGQAGAARLG